MKKNNSQEKAPGFTCPNCEMKVEVTLKGLLYDKSIKCPGCLTAFTMDRGESKEAIALMQKLNTVIENLEATKDFSPGGSGK